MGSVLDFELFESQTPVNKESENRFMNRRSITIVTVVILGAVGFAYGQGWLHWTRAGADTQSNTVDTNQASDQQKMKNDAPPLTPEAPEPAATPKK